MKKKGFETLLYSTIGVAAMFLILLAINVIGARAKTRVDLTQERAYTLSPGTMNILKKLDTPVQVRFYFTRKESAMPVFLRTYAQRVEDLLGEFQQASKGLVEIQRLDPEPDSDAEDSARLDGIEPQMAQNGERIYLGLSVSMLDQKEAIPFLSPERERLLEYDISRAISRVMTGAKPVVGVMTPLPAMGREMNPMMMQMGQRGGEPPWVLVSELRRDFTLQEVPMTTEKIPDEIKVLIVIHPKGITDAAQYAIDQFLMRGGKLVAFVDPLCVLDRQAGGMGMPSSSSTMEKLFAGWGLTFDTAKVVADATFAGRDQQGRSPAVLTLTEQAVNKDDVLTADVDNLLMVFAGAFSGTATDGLQKTVLFHSSKVSELVDTMSAQMGGEQVMKNLKPSDTEFPLAIRLTGKFKTAFPEGKPKPATPETPPGEKKPDEKKEEPPAEQGLKESTEETTVILVGDADMIQDRAAVNQVANPFGGERMFIPINGNLTFAQSAVEQLSGDSNLIAVRSRASRERPFTVVRDMQTKAESAYRDKIKQMETSLSETQTKLNELQRKKEGGQRFILSPEQQKEIENFRKKETEVKQQLKVERKKLRADIDSLENRIKWINIAAMPILVTIAGVGLALLRRSRAAAR